MSFDTSLAEAGVGVELRLRRQYPDRVYCTQYQETDTAFQITREKAQTARGESTAPHLAAGHRFTLESHPWEPANGSHVVLEVHHEGVVHAPAAEPRALSQPLRGRAGRRDDLPRTPRQRTLGFTDTPAAVHLARGQNPTPRAGCSGDVRGTHSPGASLLERS